MHTSEAIRVRDSGRRVLRPQGPQGAGGMRRHESKGPARSSRSATAAAASLSDDFRFRRFTLRQDGVSQKVGTDSMLLGAWARIPPPSEDCMRPLRILDVGTGSGVLALMLAQKAVDAGRGRWMADAIDVDERSCLTSRQNFDSCPWGGERFRVLRCSLQQLVVLISNSDPTGTESLNDLIVPISDEPPAACPQETADRCATCDAVHADDKGNYDVVICNPPYFLGSTKPLANDQKAKARHADVALLFGELAQCVATLLRRRTEDHQPTPCTPPCFYVVLPTDAAIAFEEVAKQSGLVLVGVRPTGPGY